MQIIDSYIYLYSGNPGPGMVDLVRKSLSTGVETKLILLDRGLGDLIPDFKGIEEIVHIWKANYRAVDFNRVLSMPRLFFGLKKQVSRSKGNTLINVHTLDTLIAAVLVKFFSSNKVFVVYQIRDLHKLQISSGLIGSVVRFVERNILKHVDKILVSSLGFRDFFHARYNYTGKIQLVENIPQKSSLTMETAARAASNPIKIGYIGIVRYMDSFARFISALNALVSDEKLPIRFAVAGGGLVDLLMDENRNQPHISFSGAFKYSEVIDSLYASVDVILAVYDSSDYNCQIAMPNKFYESLIKKKPIIVASGTYLAERVQELGVGVSVDPLDEEMFKNTLRDMFDPNGWYAKSITKLNCFDANILYDAYNEQLTRAISI